MADNIPYLKEEASYDDWRRQLIDWSRNTSIEPRRRAFEVRTKLDGNYRKVAFGLDARDLNQENGLDVLLDKLDSCAPKHEPRENRKLIIRDRGITITNLQVGNTNGKANEESNKLSAAEKARLRAQQLTAKLAAEGKCQKQTNVILPPKVSSAPSMPIQKLNTNPAMIKLPEIKKNEIGGYYAEFDINDKPARAFLTRSSSQELIARQSGASVRLVGRYFDEEAKRKAAIHGFTEKTLTLFVQADVSAKVLVALHKIKDVISNFNKQGASGNLNNYGLTNHIPNDRHFIQHKLFLGYETFHPEFNAVKHLLGEEGSNFNFIVQQTGAKVFLRGKGSGFLEANSGRESFEALHIYISHPDQNGLDHARQLCESLIDSVRTRYNEFEQKHVHQNNFLPTVSTNNHIQPQNMNRPQGDFIQNPYNEREHLRGNFTPQPRFHAQDLQRPPMYAATAVYNERPRHMEAQAAYNQQPPPDIYHPNLRPFNPAYRNVNPVNQINTFSPNVAQDRPYSPTDFRESPNRQPYSFSKDYTRDIPKTNTPESRHYRPQSISPERRTSRERGRSPNRRDRKRRSRSRERESKMSDRRSRSPAAREKDISPPLKDSTRYSPKRKQDSSRDTSKTKRKFSEEPRKKRRFSEDPKLLERSTKVEIKELPSPTRSKNSPPRSSRTSPPRSSRTSPPRSSRKSPPRSSRTSPPRSSRKSRKTAKSDDFVKPMFTSKSSDFGFKVPGPIVLSSSKKSSKKEDVFKAPTPLQLKKEQPKKEQPKALRIGALGSLAVYEDDSDED